jgi:hypothetical protein
MKTEELVALQSAENGRNRPGEFVLGAVDARGVLCQLAGVDEEIAAELVSIARSGASIEAQRLAKQQIEDERLALERGDTPEMARQPEWKQPRPPRTALQIPAGEKLPDPIVTGTKPRAESET